MKGTSNMKLFKVIASKAGRIVFDDRLQAECPRTAREQMKALLGLKSLTGVVYSITEIPVELIKELVNARVAEVTLGGGRNGRTPQVDVSGLIGSAVKDALAERLRPLEQRLATLEAGTSSPSRQRFDAFQRGPTRNREQAAAPTPSTTPRPRRTTPARAPKPSVAKRISGRVVESVDWPAVRRFYAQNRSPKQTAAHFDISLNTVKARIRREAW